MDNELDVIDALYSAAVDPDRFDDLVSIWYEKLEKGSHSDFGVYPGDMDRLSRHIAGVDRILEQIHDSGEDIPELFRRWVENNPHPTLLVDDDLRIRAKSLTAHSFWGATESDRLKDLLSCERTCAELESAVRRVIAQLRESPNVEPILIEQNQEDGSRPVHLSVSARNVRPGAKLAVIQSSRILWSTQFNQVFRSVFDLTEAEIDVSKLLVGGATAAEISSERGTSMATVRAQLKSIFSKTSTRNQAELVGMIAGLATLSLERQNESDDSLRQPATSVEAWPLERHRRTFRLSDGRRLSYAVVGDPAGRPCVFFHNELFGEVWPEHSARLFEQAGLNFIIPARPYYGESDPYPEDARAPEQFAHDLLELLAYLRIDRVVLISFSAGGMFSLEFAARFPEMCVGQVTIAPAFPVQSSSHENKMPISYRFMNSVVTRHPGVLETFLRMGFKYYKRKGAIGMLKNIFKDSPEDLRIITNSNYEAALTRSVDFGGLHKHKAWFHDYKDIPTSAFEKLMHSNSRVIAIVGDNDRNSRIERTDSLIKAGANLEKVIARNGGTLLHYTHGDLIVEQICHCWRIQAPTKPTFIPLAKKPDGVKNSKNTLK